MKKLKIKRAKTNVLALNSWFFNLFTSRNKCCFSDLSQAIHGSDQAP